MPYSSLVGSLLYLSVCTRPDIAFATSKRTRSLQNPNEQDWEAAKNIVRYLAGTIELGITYTRSATPLQLHGFSDSDFAGHVCRSCCMEQPPAADRGCLHRRG